MLQFFRNFFGSKIGVGVTMGFLVVIALAFAGSDVASNSAAGVLGGGDRLASVGGSKVTATELQRKAADGLKMLRERDPKLTMATFVAQGGYDDVLANMIDLAAMREFARAHGIVISDRLIDSEIAKIPGIQGPDGRIADQNYRAFLAQKGLTDAGLRAELSDALLARELLASATFGAEMPKAALVRYAGVITETRSGEVAVLPSAAFAPKGVPSEADINGWYLARRADYTLPERRVVRYATVTDAAVKDVAAPTEAEIAARYAAKKDDYAASENRKIVQLVLPTQAAAQAVAAEVSAGKSLEDAAKAKGLSVAALGSISRNAYQAQTDASVADAAFGASSGKLLGPVKGPFGYLLIRIDGIESKPGKSLEAAHGELSAAIAAEKRRAAFVNFAAKLEDELDHGAALSDIAKELGVSVSVTAPLTADGAVYGKPGEKAPPLLARVIPTAFSMEGENKAQVAEVEPGKTFVVFDVGTIATAAPPPLAQIHDRVAADFVLAKGSIGARLAAQQVEAMVRKGSPLGAAVASLKLALPPVQPVQMARQQVQAMGQNAPPPVLALFAMAKGAVKLVGAPGNRGWFVVHAKDAVPGPVKADDPRLGQFGTTLAQAAGSEYSEELRLAMRKQLGVTRNEKAIAANRAALGGSNAPSN